MLIFCPEAATSSPTSISSSRHGARSVQLTIMSILVSPFPDTGSMYVPINLLASSNSRSSFIVLFL